jgi:uncharacterized protein YdeI (YjbR/CyaY-like superfamily)
LEEIKKPNNFYAGRIKFILSAFFIIILNFMSRFSKEIDTYIAKSQTFAQPILNHLRDLIHQACPDVEEKIKWSFPNFEYKGMLCSMAAFKNHCAFTFWKAAIMSDPQKLLSVRGESAMGHFGQIKALNDLPSDKVLHEYIKEAMRLNEQGIKLPSKPKTSEKKELKIPEYFLKALKTNKNALTTFEGFSYTNKKDYVEWIVEAKTEETRNKRMATALEWLAEGKIRNWKYIK